MHEHMFRDLFLSTRTFPELLRLSRADFPEALKCFKCGKKFQTTPKVNWRTTLRTPDPTPSTELKVVLSLQAPTPLAAFQSITTVQSSPSSQKGSPPTHSSLRPSSS